MPNLDDLKRNIESLRRDLSVIGSQIAFELSSNALLFIEDRWVGEGKDADGTVEKYSDVKIPAGLLFRKRKGGGSGERQTQSFNKSTYQKLYKQAKDKKLVSYKDIRQLENLQVNHKSFKVSGRFWKSIIVQEVSSSGLKFDYVIDSSSERGKDILKYAKDGKQNILILDLSESELNILQEELTSRIFELLKSRL